MATTTTKRPNTGSRSQSARRARRLVRDYLEASTLLVALVDTDSDELETVALSMRVQFLSGEVAKLPGYAKDDAPAGLATFSKCCTPGHELRCLLGHDEVCHCQCGGANHGTLQSSSESTSEAE